MDAMTQWEDSEFLIFHNSQQKAYHIETVEEYRQKPPMAPGWQIITRAKGWAAAAAIVEQRSREGADQ